MASISLKKPCSKCTKGMSILTCDGCQQSFCKKHITDHRQELSIEMDNIGQEYDLLRRDFIREDHDFHHLFERINVWEQESTRKVQEIAQQARNDLRHCLDESKTQITNLSNKLADEIQTSQKSEDYTEIDFNSWTGRLNELRMMLQKPPIIDISEDENTLVPIRMIIVKEKSDVQSSHASTRVLDHNSLSSWQSHMPISQMFDKFIGHALFFENHLVATHADDPHRSIMVYLTQSYFSGTHRIRFRIEQKRNKCLFVGIINAGEEMNRAVFNSPSLYGWMTPDMRVVKSRKAVIGNLNETFRADDEILLTLNCNIHQILFEHPRTITIDQLSIDPRVCLLPWRVVVAFFSPNDSIRLIR